MSVDLLRIASRVVWWDLPEHVAAREDDFLCRVMALGNLQDARAVEEHFGRERMAQALRQRTGWCHGCTVVELLARASGAWAGPGSPRPATG